MKGRRYSRLVPLAFKRPSKRNINVLNKKNCSQVKVENLFWKFVEEQKKWKIKTSQQTDSPLVIAQKKNSKKIIIH